MIQEITQYLADHPVILGSIAVFALLDFPLDPVIKQLHQSHCGRRFELNLTLKTSSESRSRKTG